MKSGPKDQKQDKDEDWLDVAGLQLGIKQLFTAAQGSTVVIPLTGSRSLLRAFLRGSFSASIILRRKMLTRRLFKNELRPPVSLHMPYNSLARPCNSHQALLTPKFHMTRPFLARLQKPFLVLTKRSGAPRKKF